MISDQDPLTGYLKGSSITPALNPNNHLIEEDINYIIVPCPHFFLSGQCLLKDYQ